MENSSEAVWEGQDALNLSTDLQPWTGNVGTGARTGSGTGTGTPGEDNPPGPDDQVRLWTTERLRKFIGTLQPYVDGTFGEVSPRHGALYLRAVAELNRLWNARYLPPAPEPAEESEEQEVVRTQERAALVRERVLDQLAELRARNLK